MQNNHLCAAASDQWRHQWGSYSGRRSTDAHHDDDDVTHYDTGSRTAVHSTKVINQQFTIVFSKLRMPPIRGVRKNEYLHYSVNNFESYYMVL